MNHLVNDPLLRYASLAGAGLPACDQHLARARGRPRALGRDAGRVARDTAVPHASSEWLHDEVEFTVSLFASEADANATRLPELDDFESPAVTGGPKRKLVLLAY